MRAATTILYEFGPFRLDPSLPLLTCGERPVHLPPKALETLVALVERSGRVVSREELYGVVWPDTAVEENNLSVNVSLLRKALGEAADGETYIETVPRRGYRFAAPVRGVAAETRELFYERRTRSQILIEESQEIDAPAEITLESSPARAASAHSAPLGLWSGKTTRMSVAIAGVVIVAFVAVLAAAGFVGRGRQVGEEQVTGQRKGAAAFDAAAGAAVKSLAVMPFRSVGAADYAARNANMAGEMTDAVLARLDAEVGLSLVPRGAVLAERMSPNNLLLAGRALQSDAVLTGALFKSDPGEVYLRLHLVGTNGGEVLWAETFRQSREDLPALLDAVARGVRDGLQRLSDADEYERRARRHTANREAYQLYIQARFLWEQRHDVFDPDQLSIDEQAISLGLLERALALDPNFALAHVAAADNLKTAGYRSDSWRRAEEHALRAAALDPALAEPHATLGFIRMFHHWDWAGAEAEFRRAIELDEKCVTAHQWYALFHALRGDNLKATQEINRARELAPYSFSILLDAAEMQYYTRPMLANYTIAASSLRHAVALNPQSGDARGLLAQAYWMVGDLRASAELRGWDGNPQDLARHLAGPGEVGRIEGDDEQLETYYRARWHAYLGNREEALDLLERAHRAHHFFIIYLKADPFFDPLRGEPRFQELLRRIGLDQ